MGYSTKLQFLLFWIVSLSAMISTLGAPINGFLEFTPDPNTSASNVVAFSEIDWANSSGGFITTASGATVAFDEATVSQFVYMNDAYYAAMVNNASYKPLHSSVASREVIVPSSRTDITTDSDIEPFIIGTTALESLIKLAPQYEHILTPIEETLNSEIAHYRNGEKKINNEWTRLDPSQNSRTANAATGSNDLDITTIEGVTYNHVNHVSATDDSISFLYEDGGATVNLALLPPDLQKRFHYNPQAIADREAAAEKEKADAAAQAQNLMDSKRAAIESDIKNFVQLSQSSPTLSGQIFIVTKGGNNFKLGGIHVYLFTKSQIDFALDPKKQEAAEQLPILVDKIKAEKDQYSQADAANTNGQAIVENGIYYDPAKRMTELQNSILTLENNAQYYLSPEYFFTALPECIAQTTTDADGNFKFNVPQGEYVLAAKGSREIIDQTEHYYWMIHFDMGNLSRAIQLSNENLTSAGSDDSVISTNDPDSSGSE